MQDGARRNVEVLCSLIVGPVHAKVKGFMVSSDQFNVHLSTTEDETLLWRGNTRLLLYFLFDPSDLW